MYGLTALVVSNASTTARVRGGSGAASRPTSPPTRRRSPRSTPASSSPRSSRQGTFAEMIRAGGAGLGGFYTPVGAGTLLAAGKEERVIDGVPHVLERAAACRRRARLRVARGRAREPLVPQDGAQLQPGDGDRGRAHDRRGGRDRPGRRHRARVRRHAPPLRRPSRGERTVTDDPRVRGSPPGRRRELAPGRRGQPRHRDPEPDPRLPRPGTEVFLHTENGLLGVGPRPDRTVDPDLIDAAKRPVTALPGRVLLRQRGQLRDDPRRPRRRRRARRARRSARAGDIANWAVPGKDVLGVGGAMDLVVGARRVIVTMTATSSRASRRSCRNARSR